MVADAAVLQRLPHRPPFLWIDRIVEMDEQRIHAEKDLPEDLDIFRGHYPDHPLMPGVLLCEAVFQAGALLIVELAGIEPSLQGAVPVLTRIQSARFKREVGPGATINIHATLKERLSSAWFLKGSVKLQDKVALQVEFACSLKEG
ncbi:MAG: beta-hydroxyacyl-ACP dehydratase [Desulfobulbus propionicus]|nr:MAG: beta-hydroxyacyl-ACP dehydratase [Desulfobulbus propionicus]